MSQSFRLIRIRADIWRGLHKVKAKEGRSISKIVEELYNSQYGSYIDFGCSQTFINTVPPADFGKLGADINRRKRGKK